MHETPVPGARRNPAGGEGEHGRDTGGGREEGIFRRSTKWLDPAVMPVSRDELCRRQRAAGTPPDHTTYIDKLSQNALTCSPGLASAKTNVLISSANLS
jgi:hypothetical protein